ncbi:MAG TPA: BON domain-containing protein, partial [Burkholderiales bacterium]
AGGAPKIGNRADWEPRAAQGKLALYETALKGKPNTAMMAKGGFRDLSRDEVMSAVDYMVAQAGFEPGLHPEAPPAKPTEALAPAAAMPAAEIGGAAVAEVFPATPQPEAIEVAMVDSSPKAPVEIDDRAITEGVAGALRREVAPPDAKIETYEGVTTVGGVGIKIQTRMGVVTLSGMVKNAEIVERAEAIARAVEGAKSVDNKLVSATIFEWD